MKKFAKIMLIALGFGLVTVALGFLTSNPAPAQLPPPVVPVKVTNTPLPVQGSVSAAVTGTVAASQNGAWNVGVNNLPAVQSVSFAGTQPVSLSGTSPVSISNGPFSPIIVEPDAAAAAHADELNCVFNGSISGFQSGQNVCTFSSIQAGQNRVVENFGLTLTVAAGTIIENAFLGFFQPPPAQTVPMLFLSLTKMGTNGIFDYYVGEQEGHVYLQSSTTPGCVVTTFAPNGNGLLSMQCTINGHDVPAN
jgi:hypothetical protein